MKDVMEEPSSLPLRILLHAPTADALQRARNNAANVIAAVPSAEVRIIVNAGAVAPVLDGPQTNLDELTLVCGNTLATIGREIRPPLKVVAGAVLTIAQMQRGGWCYVRS